MSAINADFYRLFDAASFFSHFLSLCVSLFFSRFSFSFWKSKRFNFCLLPFLSIYLDFGLVWFGLTFECCALCLTMLENQLTNIYHKRKYLYFASNIIPKGKSMPDIDRISNFRCHLFILELKFFCLFSNSYVLVDLFWSLVPFQFFVVIHLLCVSNNDEIEMKTT